ncbi:glycosyl transferase family 1 [Sulfolobales archaeon HS-7]|nr:glycosyl transferase family 1 [Sulfolobales archaeon HS-7]
MIHKIPEKLSGENKVFEEALISFTSAGYKVVIASFSKPRRQLSAPVAYSLPFYLERLDKYQRFLVSISARKTRPDVFFNVSGIPIRLSDLAPHIIYGAAPAIASVPTKYSSSRIWSLYLLPFKLMRRRLADEARRAHFIANSRYSAKAIKEVYEVEPEVIYPPVNVDFFSKAYHESSENYFLTIGRFERGKNLERAVEFADVCGLKGFIIGYVNDVNYFRHLQEIVTRRRVNVSLLPNLREEEILSYMRNANIYFHPTIGEHFGIPVVEAMAAGVVPIVPKESGASEVVPETSYDSIKEACEIANQVKNNIVMRRELALRSSNFSPRVFREKILNYVEVILSKR